MRNNKRFNKPKVANLKCNCGKVMVQRSRTNYPFGKNSGGIATKFYRCAACGFRSN